MSTHRHAPVESTAEAEPGQPTPPSDLRRLLDAVPCKATLPLYSTDQLLGEVLEQKGCSPAALAALVPSNRAGSKTRTVKAETVWRWATSGVRGPEGVKVKLEALRLGGRLISSKPALERFLRALQGLPVEPAPVPAPVPAAVSRADRKARAAQLAATDAELEQLGI